MEEIAAVVSIEISRGIIRRVNIIPYQTNLDLKIMTLPTRPGEPLRDSRTSKMILIISSNPWEVEWAVLQ